MSAQGNTKPLFGGVTRAEAGQPAGIKHKARTNSAPVPSHLLSAATFINSHGGADARLVGLVNALPNAPHSSVALNPYRPAAVSPQGPSFCQLPGWLRLAGLFRGRRQHD